MSNLEANQNPDTGEGDSGMSNQTAEREEQTLTLEAEQWAGLFWVPRPQNEGPDCGARPPREWGGAKGVC